MDVQPKDYIIQDYFGCFACIGNNGDDNYWILGDSFLRGFYSIHDGVNYKMGFAPHSKSTKKAPIKGNKPDILLPIN